MVCFFFIFLLHFFSVVLIFQNESINGHHKNVKFLWADVTSPELDIHEDSVDFIFSNLLLMYLSDEEVRTVLLLVHVLLLV